MNNIKKNSNDKYPFYKMFLETQKLLNLINSNNKNNS